MRIQTRALTSPSCRTGTSKDSRSYGRIRQSPAGHRSLAPGGAADITAGAELLCREFRLEDAGRDGAVLQRGRVVIERDQGREQRLGFRRGASCRTGEICRDADRPRCRRARRSRASGDGRSNVSAARSTRSRNTAQWASIREKDGVVADRADIAQMVGETFHFRHQGTQPVRHAAADRTPSAASTARAKANGIGDGAVAGDAAGQLRGTLQVGTAHQALRCPCGYSRAALPGGRWFRHWRESGNVRAR